MEHQPDGKHNQREILEETGRRILNAVRTQLYLSMPFMGQALGSLQFTMDLSTTHVGTDAVSILFNPNYLMQTYVEFPFQLNRVYMHLLMHCLFRHMFHADRYPDKELWNLCCDIAAESVVDSIDNPAVERTMTDQRAAIYADLESNVKVLTAPRLYQYFSERPRNYDAEEHLQREFYMDDHAFWPRMERSPAASEGGAPSDPGRDGLQKNSENSRKSAQNHDDEGAGDNKSGESPENAPEAGGQKAGRNLREIDPDELDRDWEKNAQKVRAALEQSGKEAGEEKGSLSRLLYYELREQGDYREWLKKFTVLREEAGIDPDSFDYGFYNYGMEMYGDMPLIEENEFREVNKVEQLVIAIDTSASCQDRLVQKFLNETASILLTGNGFFRRVEVHLILCDDQVQSDLLIQNPQEMKRFADGFHMKGGFGTDFRPVFRYVEDLRAKGNLRGLKGLLYFTDGYGIYPKRATDYETAFAFQRGEDFDDSKVPDWAAKLYV